LWLVIVGLALGLKQLYFQLMSIIVKYESRVPDFLPRYKISQTGLNMPYPTQSFFVRNLKRMSGMYVFRKNATAVTSNVLHKFFK
jgi:hypothetical protein